MILLRAGDEELDAAIGSTSLASAVVAVELQPVVNLVVSELITRLGRRNVLVVPQHGDGTAVRLLEAWTPQPFAPGIGMDELTRRVAAGAAVTPCPDGLPDAAIPLVAVRPGAAVDLRPGMHTPAPDATVVALVGGAT